MKKFFVAIATLAATQSWAANEYYSLSRSFRALGMGGAYYALSDDESAMFYNPAGLSTRELPWQFMFPIKPTLSQNAISSFSLLKDTFSNTNNISQVISNLESLQGRPYSVGIGLFPHFVKKNFGIGLLLADTKVNFGILGAGIDSSAEITAVSDSGLFLTYARPIGLEELHIGLTAKFLARAGGKRTYNSLEIAQNQSSNLNLEQLGGFGLGLDFDLGAIYEMPKPLIPWALQQRFSFTLSNIFATTFPIAKRGAPPQLPRYFSLGSYTLFPGWGPVSNFIFCLDFAEFNLGGQTDPALGARVGSFWKHLNWGIEMPLGRVFTLRTGFHQGSFTAGFGLNIKYLRLDFAWYGEEIGTGVDRINDRRLALQISIGGGTLGEKQRTEESLKKKKEGGGEEEEVKPAEPPPSEEDAKKKSGESGVPGATEGTPPGGAPAEGGAAAPGAAGATGQPAGGDAAKPAEAPKGDGKAPAEGNQKPSESKGSESKAKSAEEQQAAEEAWQDVEVQPGKSP